MDRLAYRLAWEMPNGLVAYSQVVELQVGADNELFVKIFPNPARGKFFLDIASHQAGEYKIVIFDRVGREILKQVHPLQKGKSLIKFELPLIAPGLYHVRVSASYGSVLLTTFQLQ